MDHVLGLKCTICGAEHGIDQVEYVCPRHGSDGTLDVLYDYPLIGRHIDPERLATDPTRSIWRYLPLLPVDAGVANRLRAGTVLGTVGWTPLYPAPRLAGELGILDLWVKDDGRQPTASFKDRASAIAVVKARELGYEVITTASTGNAAAALSGLCAAVAQRNVIFVPRTAPQAKIAQLLAYGSTVLLVDGTYDEAFELCLKAAPEFGWYNRSTGYNPYMSEGKKTAAYEVCEQLTSTLAAGGHRSRPLDDAPLQAPDRIFVPVGDGCIIGGVHKGLCDLLALGWIDHMPRLMGIQAAGSSPLVAAWEHRLDAAQMQPVEAHTVADSICAALPRDRIKAMRAVIESQGAFIRVSDEEIIAAIPALARGCGVFAEPAAAAAYAGLVKAVQGGMVDPAERVVVLSTGSGLKDVAAAVRAVAPPPVIAPDLDDVRRVLS
ncbi:MAG: threonine synthase [Anaerolineae bacterium]|nr:threonine synthase [Anaerolineae bacterium]